MNYHVTVITVTAGQGSDLPGLEQQTGHLQPSRPRLLPEAQVPNFRLPLGATNAFSKWFQAPMESKNSS